MLTPEGSNPVNPSSDRSARVNAVPRLIIGVASTAIPRAEMRAVYPPSVGPGQFVVSLGHLRALRHRVMFSGWDSDRKW